MHIQLLLCVTFGPHEGTLNRLENSQLNLTARICDLKEPLSGFQYFSVSKYVAL